MEQSGLVFLRVDLDQYAREGDVAEGQEPGDEWTLEEIAAATTGVNALQEFAR